MSGSNPSQPENATYDATVYQLQATDECQGASSNGPGILNQPLQNLTNRTGWLKAQIAAVIESLSGYALINSQTFTGTPKAPTPALGDSSTALATTAFVQQAIATSEATQQVFYTSSSWTCPAGVFWVRVRLWGGGGPGGAGNGGSGGGGAGGGYVEAVVPVEPGTVYQYIIGSGGSGTTAGGESSFNNALFATGGGPGNPGPNGNGSTSYGAGSVSSGTSITFEGQSGTNGLSTASVNFSGAGGSAFGFAGGIGVILPSSVNQAGGPGQVGCGGSGGVGTGAGGLGVGGLLILEY